MVPRPKVKTKHKFPKHGITVIVHAYRKISRIEAWRAFLSWRAAHPKKKLLPGHVLEVCSILGFDGGAFR